MTLITENPFWLIIFCVFAGIIYSTILYRKEIRFSETNIWLVRLMGVSRFCVVTLLSFFLLSPLLKTINRTVEKPVIIIGQDNTQSILCSKDSTTFKNNYQHNLQNLMDELGEKYEVRLYSFGDKIKELTITDSITYDEKQTDISAFFDEIETRYSNRNVGAVIVASDGLYNKGSNPCYYTDKIKFPVYTIALGDTTIKKDIILSKVNYNRLAYLGNQFQLEIIVDAKQLKGKTTTVTINKEGATIYSQAINFNTESFESTIAVTLDAKQIGLQHYKIKLSTIAEEMSFANNELDVFIDVMDTRQKILILADAPHPDIGAIKQAIDANQNYEVETSTTENFNQSLKKYNLLVLYQLPNQKNPINKILNEINIGNTPILAFTGATNIINSSLSSNSTNQKSNESEAVLEQQFSLFTISDELRKGVKDFPAVICPFGNYASENSSNVLLYQRIGVVDTKTPLLYFNSVVENKIAIFEGEGIWRWRMQDFAAHGNHNLFDELITKTVQYLSVKVDKSFFRISKKNNYKENEPIEMESEVYNDSYELINEPDVSITFKNSENKIFPFVFNKTTKAYQLNAGMMPVGEYKFEAKTKVGEKIYSQHGEFSVSALQVELTNTIANHQLLYSLAKKNNGEMIYPSNIKTLSEKLNSRGDIKSISYSEKKLNDLINLKWIFFLFISLLSIEWFIRKRNGAY